VCRKSCEYKEGSKIESEEIFYGERDVRNV
jgi:hypothetical protein